MIANLLKSSVFLFFVLQMNFLFAQTDAKKADVETSQPKYTIVLNYMEFSILNSAMVDGIGKYQGNIELGTNAKYSGNQVLWEVTTRDKLVLDVLNLYVAQKSMEFLKTINIDSAIPVEKVTIASLSALSIKLDEALKNPVWEVRKIAGTLSKDKELFFVSSNNNKTELTGKLKSGLQNLTGQKVIVTGSIKEPGKIEMTSISVLKGKTLELFIMSQCPYGIQALNYVFGKTDSLSEKNQINFEVHYIFSKNGNNYTSLHGEQEIVENLVQIVIRDNYPKFFAKYLKQRISNPSVSWEQIATNLKMDKDIIRQIDDEITDNRIPIIQTEFSYMMDNFQQINASPTFVWESEIVNNFDEIPGFQGGHSGEIQKCKN